MHSGPPRRVALQRGTVTLRSRCRSAITVARKPPTWRCTSRMCESRSVYTRGFQGRSRPRGWPSVSASTVFRSSASHCLTTSTPTTWRDKPMKDLATLTDAHHPDDRFPGGESVHDAAARFAQGFRSLQPAPRARCWRSVTNCRSASRSTLRQVPWTWSDPSTRSRTQLPTCSSAHRSKVPR